VQSAPRSGFEELDGVPVRVEDLNLLAARADLDLVSEGDAAIPEGCDKGREIAHRQHEPVPATGRLRLCDTERREPEPKECRGRLG